jgi:hypothetical protein
MDEDPIASAAVLQTTGLGCRLLIDRLEGALDTLLNLGYWSPEEIRDVVRLFGCFPELERLRESPVAYFLTLENLSCQPEPADEAIAALLRPEFQPAEFAGRSRRNVDTMPAACRDRIERMVENRLTRLRALEEELRTGRDARQRSQVVDPNMMIADPVEFHRYDRYSKDANASFNRCYKLLEATLATDAARAESADQDGNHDSSDAAAGTTPPDAATAEPELSILTLERDVPSAETPEEPIVPAASPKPVQPESSIPTSKPSVPAREAAGSSVEPKTCVDQTVLSGTQREPSVPPSDGPGEPPVPASDGRFLVRAAAELVKRLGAEAGAVPRPEGGPWPAGPPGEAESGL